MTAPDAKRKADMATDTEPVTDAKPMDMTTAREPVTDAKPVAIGVKFCGGCNPRYDRGALLRKIRDAQPDWSIDIAEPGTVYKHLLVICGCTSACADISDLTAERICMITAPEDAAKVIRSECGETAE
ncbi:MAG: hypothetical protein MSS48_04725 [Clostridiales bacterium]|nr:hypothetical protein [Clostridiales bacterium]